MVFYIFFPIKRNKNSPVFISVSQSCPTLCYLRTVACQAPLSMEFSRQDYHLMQRANSLEKTLRLGKIEGKRRRGWQRRRWLDGITDSMNMSPGDGSEGQGSLVCCSSRSPKVGTQISKWTTTTKTVLTKNSGHLPTQTAPQGPGKKQHWLDLDWGHLGGLGTPDLLHKWFSTQEIMPIFSAKHSWQLSDKVYATHCSLFTSKKATGTGTPWEYENYEQNYMRI